MSLASLLHDTALQSLKKTDTDAIDIDALIAESEQVTSVLDPSSYAQQRRALVPSIFPLVPFCGITARQKGKGAFPFNPMSDVANLCLRDHDLLGLREHTVKSIFKSYTYKPTIKASLNGDGNLDLVYSLNIPLEDSRHPGRRLKCWLPHMPVIYSEMVNPDSEYPSVKLGLSASSDIFTDEAHCRGIPTANELLAASGQVYVNAVDNLRKQLQHLDGLDDDEDEDDDSKEDGTQPMEEDGTESKGTKKKKAAKPHKPITAKLKSAAQEMGELRLELISACEEFLDHPSRNLHLWRAGQLTMPPPAEGKEALWLSLTKWNDVSVLDDGKNAPLTMAHATAKHKKHIASYSKIEGLRDVEARLKGAIANFKKELETAKSKKRSAKFPRPTASVEFTPKLTFKIVYTATPGEAGFPPEISNLRPSELAKAAPGLLKQRGVQLAVSHAEIYTNNVVDQATVVLKPCLAFNDEGEPLPHPEHGLEKDVLHADFVKRCNLTKAWKAQCQDWVMGTQKPAAKPKTKSKKRKREGVDGEEPPAKKAATEYVYLE